MYMLVGVDMLKKRPINRRLETSMTTSPWVFLIQTWLLLIPNTILAKVPALIVFGDSTVDTGNNNYIPTIAKANFGPYGRDFPGGAATGRFCNGRLTTDITSQSLGLKPIVPAYLDPNYNIADFSTGVCFASAGTGFDDLTAGLTKVIPIWTQVEFYKEYQKRLRAYLGTKGANTIIRDALYLISIGTNDFIVNYYVLPHRRLQFTVDEYQEFLIGLIRLFLEQIYGLGARKISLAGFSPIGCLPVERSMNFKESHGCKKELNEVALEFNVKLKGMVAKLNKELPGMRMVLSNPYEIVMKIITRPSLYGFEVVELGCCGTGRIETTILCNELSPLTCTDATKYMFWDSVHPTEKTNQIVSDYLFNNYIKTIL